MEKVIEVPEWSVIEMVKIIKKLGQGLPLQVLWCFGVGTHRNKYRGNSFFRREDAPKDQ